MKPRAAGAFAGHQPTSPPPLSSYHSLFHWLLHLLTTFLLFLRTYSAIKLTTSPIPILPARELPFCNHGCTSLPLALQTSTEITIQPRRSRFTPIQPTHHALLRSFFPKLESQPKHHYPIYNRTCIINSNQPQPKFSFTTRAIHFTNPILN